MEKITMNIFHRLFTKRNVDVESLLKRYKFTLDYGRNFIAYDGDGQKKDVWLVWIRNDIPESRDWIVKRFKTFSEAVDFMVAHVYENEVKNGRQ
jgi:hypothetical protein